MFLLDASGEEESHGIPDGLLVSLLHRKLMADIAELRLPEATQLVSSVISNFRLAVDSGASCGEGLGRAVTQLTPFIHQYRGLVQSCLYRLVRLNRCTCKLLSVLLAVFTELVTRGFCLPPEVDEEASGDGATEFEDIEGGGLGQGEGVKDVSDQIESEDQVRGYAAGAATF